VHTDGVDAAKKWLVNVLTRKAFRKK
jgi:hypothetical protein